MDCSKTQELLDEYLDGELDAARRQAFETHLGSCADCSASVAEARHLNGLLRRLPAPAVRPEFTRAAFARARREHRQSRWLPRMAAGALAAGFAVWMVTVSLLGTQDTAPEMPVQFVSVDEVKTISVAMNSQRALSNVTLTLVLPEGLEIEGYQGQRELSWKTNLVAGVNLLPLPIRALNAGSGTLIARITHEGQSRELLVPITADGNQQSFLILDSMQAG